MSTAIDHTYRYPFASCLKRQDKGARLDLATCRGLEEHPYFFEGSVRRPRHFATMLLTLSEVVRTHFFRPMPPNLDPVLTCSEDMLRLEGFSGCCGVYARIDLPPASFDGTVHRAGTTNVDFNEPLRGALKRLSGDGTVAFAVGRDEVVLKQDDERFVEKKVKLPLRWLKGFSEVQAYQTTLSPVFELSAPDALRFLRSLSKSGRPKRPSFVVPAGRSLRLTQRESAHAVRLSGTHRIKVLEPLLVMARTLRVWRDESAGTSAWEVGFDPGTFFLMISPDFYRGFSGEGQVLTTLAAGRGEKHLARVRAALAWQSAIDSAALARELELDQVAVDTALAVLGTRGLAGYDVTSGHYFHRVLPFDLSQVEALQPRLLNARRLLAEGKVTSAGGKDSGSSDFIVRGSDVEHYVRLRPEGDRCSCPWFSRYRGKRGPCKHLLAAQFLFETQDES